jgi:hypothetical protein
MTDTDEKRYRVLAAAEENLAGWTAYRDAIRVLLAERDQMRGIKPTKVLAGVEYEYTDHRGLTRVFTLGRTDGSELGPIPAGPSKLGDMGPASAAELRIDENEVDLSKQGTDPAGRPVMQPDTFGGDRNIEAGG